MRTIKSLTDTLHTLTGSKVYIFNGSQAMSRIPSHVCNTRTAFYCRHPDLSLDPLDLRSPGPSAGAFSFKLGPFTQGRGAAEGSKEIRPASPYDDNQPHHERVGLGVPAS